MKVPVVEKYLVTVQPKIERGTFFSPSLLVNQSKSKLIYCGNNPTESKSPHEWRMQRRRVNERSERNGIYLTENASVSTDICSVIPSARPLSKNCLRMNNRPLPWACFELYHSCYKQPGCEICFCDKATTTATTTIQKVC